MCLMSVFAFHYICTNRPYWDKWLVWTEIMNECTIMFSYYFQFMFTAVVDKPEARYTIGWAYIVVMSLNILLNLFLIFFVDMGGKLYWHVYLRYKKDQRIRLL